MPPSMPPSVPSSGPSREQLANTLAAVHNLTGLVGWAPSFVESICALPAFAQGDAAVIIGGETGTGKELVARAVHYLSRRAQYPFVPVNCGALPDTLLEDELFGHERGAFTDARARRVGLVEEAHRGTLFLDEVDSLTPRAQVLLLRLVQEKTVRPLGGGRERRVDVRFVAATNRPLEPMVEAGEFRADLYFRLAVLTLTLPPLRERVEDILPLARHLMQKNLRPNEAEPRFSPSAVAALMDAAWPGNVRELENAVLRALHLARHGVIEPRDLGLNGGPRTLAAAAADPAALPVPDPPAQTLPSDRPTDAGMNRLTFREAKERVVTAFEREYLTTCLAEHAGNVTQAARAAGKERREFGKLLKKHRIDPRDFALHR